MNLPRLVLGLVRFLEETAGIAVAIATPTIQGLICPPRRGSSGVRGGAAVGEGGQENAIMVEGDFPLLLFLSTIILFYLIHKLTHLQCQLPTASDTHTPLHCPIPST